MKYTLIFILILFTSIGFSQTEREKPLKVGLVLSGGGAKGFAHIGALKVIDSLGIKVDYVAGTSMGAIIGALYASGYSGIQLDSIFKTLNFNDVISDNIPRAAKSFYEKRNSEQYAVTLPFDNFKITLPSAISRGQNVYNLLTQLTLHVSNIDDFSKLPIPFFCIGTNIETGEQVVLDRGNLAMALLASGAFPSLFEPVVIGDKILIDGGVTNNYPIKELKEKGVDVIIGVDVQDDLSDRLQLNSADKILVQINNYRTINDMKIKSKLTDIYIKPDIKEFTVISFSQGEKLIKNGVDAAILKLDKLTGLIQNKNIVKNRSTIVKNFDSIHIKSIAINGNRNYTRSYIIGKLRLKNNEKVSYKRFIDGVNNLVATDNFDEVSYRFQELDQNYHLILNLRESASKTLIKFALHYDDLYKSAALINLTQKRLFTNNDVASFDFILGDHIRYNFEYFIDKGFYLSVGLKSRFNSFNNNINANLILSEPEIESFSINKIDAHLSDFTNQFYLQTLFQKDFTLSAGAELKRIKIDSETFLEDINDEETVFENSDYFSFFGNLKIDKLNDKYFPTNGFYFNGDFNLYLYSSDFNDNFSEFSIAKADIGFAFKLAPRLAMVLRSSGGFKIGEDSTRPLNFALGGGRHNYINNFYPFFGYDYFSLTGNSFVKGNINLDYEIFDKHHINLTGNFANIEDNIFETGEWITAPDYSGYGVGYSIETFLGPLEAKYTWSPEVKNGYWFFNVGFWF